MNSTAWLLFAGTVCLWAASAFLPIYLSRRWRSGWRALPLSLFGFAWVAFGATYILRFLALLYDSTLFRASLFPPWLMPSSALSRAWCYLAVHWCVLCAGWLAVMFLGPRRLPGAFARLDLVALGPSMPALDLLAASATAVLMLMSIVELPKGLTTPIGHFCSLWVIPAAFAWQMHFQNLRVGGRRFAYLVPGLALFLVSPYREHILALFLCLLLPAIQWRRGGGPVRVAALTLVVLLASSVGLYVYRPIRMEGQELSATKRFASPGEWTSNPEEAPWTKLSTRLHGFDSAALTMWLVPRRFPYQDRQVIVELLAASLLPRAVYADKAFVQRGRIFSTSIWSYNEYGEVSERPSAMIAPSMAGDLWAAGGPVMLVLGSLAWGLAVGLLDRWRASLAPASGTVLVILFALRVAGGVERDFVFATATIIQVTIVVLLVLALLPLARQRPVWADTGLAGSQRTQGAARPSWAALPGGKEPDCAS